MIPLPLVCALVSAFRASILDWTLIFSPVGECELECDLLKWFSLCESLADPWMSIDALRYSFISLCSSFFSLSLLSLLSDCFSPFGEQELQFTSFVSAEWYTFISWLEAELSLNWCWLFTLSWIGELVCNCELECNLCASFISLWGSCSFLCSSFVSLYLLGDGFSLGGEWCPFISLTSPAPLVVECAHIFALVDISIKVSDWWSSVLLSPGVLHNLWLFPTTAFSCSLSGLRQLSPFCVAPQISFSVAMAEEGSSIDTRLCFLLRFTLRLSLSPLLIPLSLVLGSLGWSEEAWISPARGHPSSFSSSLSDGKGVPASSTSELVGVLSFQTYPRTCL